MRMFRARSGSFRKIRRAQEDIVGLGPMSMVLAPYSVVSVSTSLSLSGESRWKMWTFPSRVEPPFGGPGYVLQYLGRYTHRVAISNHRLVSFADGQVTFRWRDSADGNKQKPLPLSVNEFLTRFLLHILPQGFVRIRNFGFLANRRRSTLLPLCFHLLGTTPQPPAEKHSSSTEDAAELYRCPYCGGPMKVIERLTAAEILLRSSPEVTAAV